MGSQLYTQNIWKERQPIFSAAHSQPCQESRRRRLLVTATRICNVSMLERAKWMQRQTHHGYRSHSVPSLPFLDHSLHAAFPLRFPSTTYSLPFTAFSCRSTASFLPSTAFSCQPICSLIYLLMPTHLPSTLQTLANGRLTFSRSTENGPAIP